MSEESEELSLDGLEEQAKVRFWLGALKDAKEEADPWLNETKEAWREYQSENSAGKYRQLRDWECNNYPRYWSDSQVMAPALYGAQPVLVARRRFDRDPTSRTASILLEKFATYLLEQSNFDACMDTSVLEFIHGAHGTGRVYFHADIIKRTKRVPVYATQTMDDEGQETTVYTDDEGNEVGDEVLQDELGGYYYEVEGEEEEVESPRVYVKALHFDEIRVSPGARQLCDVWWMAYRVKITLKEAKERFGNIVEDMPEAEEESERKGKSSDGSLFCYWEIWDKRDRKVYWLCEQVKDKFLDQDEDLYELVDFFPTPPPMLTNQRNDSVWPTPDYTHTRDMYENMHLLAKRVNVVSKAIQAKSIADGSRPELQLLLEQAKDGETVFVPNLRDIMGEGGLDGLILFLPYERLAGILQQLIQVMQLWKREIDEARGITDLMRGNSEPATSATAERIKQGAGKSRFSKRQKEVQRFARDLIEMMCDLALKTFSDEQIQEIVGYAFLDPEDQQRFAPALSVLRDDKARLVRIDIETDSTIALNEQQDKENAMELMSSVAQYIKPMIDGIQQTPQIAPLVFKVLELSIQSFRTGKHAEDELGQVFQTIQESISSPPQPPPTPPDYKAQELQLKQMQQQMEGYLSQAKLQIEQMDAQLRQRQQVFAEQMEVAKLNIDQQEQDAVMRERLMEEQRLAAQNIQIPQERMQMEAMMKGQPEPKSPAVVINVAQPEQQPQLPAIGGITPINPYLGGL